MPVPSAGTNRIRFQGSGEKPPLSRKHGSPRAGSIIPLRCIFCQADFPDPIPGKPAANHFPGEPVLAACCLWEKGKVFPEDECILGGDVSWPGVFLARGDVGEDVERSADIVGPRAAKNERAEIRGEKDLFSQRSPTGNRAGVERSFYALRFRKKKIRIPHARPRWGLCSKWLHFSWRRTCSIMGRRCFISEEFW